MAAPKPSHRCLRLGESRCARLALSRRIPHQISGFTYSEWSKSRTWSRKDNIYETVVIPKLRKNAGMVMEIE